MDLKTLGENTKRHFLINKFLLEVNKLMDGIYVEEITEYHHPRVHVKFEAKLTCIYAHPCMWSPTEKFYETIMNAAKKYFDDVHNVDDFGWNNTNTIFWIGAEKIS